MQNKRFGIHKKYGVDINNTKRKPTMYKLVEVTPKGEERIIRQTTPEHYALLVSIKNNLIRANGNFYISKNGYSLKILPVYD